MVKRYREVEGLVSTQKCSVVVPFSLYVPLTHSTHVIPHSITAHTHRWSLVSNESLFAVAATWSARSLDTGGSLRTQFAKTTLQKKIHKA